MKAKKGKITNCSECKTPLYRKPSQLKKRKHHFCNNKCQAAYSSKHLSGKNNKLWKGGEEVNRKNYRLFVNNRKVENKQKAVMMLGGKCKCGYNKCIDALQFHHIDPKQKDDDVCQMLTKEWSEKIENEIRKCELLCANCHAEFHWNTRHA